MSLEYNYSNNFEGNMNEEREKLAEDIYEIMEWTIQEDIDRVVDYILEDRKRICAPLISSERIIEANNADIMNYYVANQERKNAVSTTLKLAGLEDGKWGLK